MSQTIPEKDWRIFREMKNNLLQAQCEKSLSRISGILQKQTADAHATYLEVYKAVKEEDRIIGEIFDDHRRSTAIFSLAVMVRHGLITPEDRKRFSPETQARIEFLSDSQ